MFVTKLVWKRVTHWSFILGQPMKWIDSSIVHQNQDGGLTKWVCVNCPFKRKASCNVDDMDTNGWWVTENNVIRWMDSLVLVLKRNECHFTRANVDYAISTDPLEWLDGTFLVWVYFNVNVTQYYNISALPVIYVLYVVINSLIIRKTINTNIAIHN